MILSNRAIDILSFMTLTFSLLSLPATEAKSEYFTKLSPRIVIDQFGYLPNAEKIAVIRSPRKGYDAEKNPLPDPAMVELIDKKTRKVVFKAKVQVWNQGQTDDTSGDGVWWFDFSTVTTPGTFFVSDPSTGDVSPDFNIDQTVYCDVLRQAVRTFFYQRSGFAKEARFAGVAWADEASHMQDKKSRRFLAKSDPTTEKDLHGGWYDAGDFNKYTAWTASYIVQLLHTYRDSPDAFSDQTNIPESGNGIPDILDEALWGLAWLKRMQLEDGSILSIVNGQSASPPSQADQPSYYGDANSIATLKGAQAFAYASRVFHDLRRPELRTQASDFLQRAEKSYRWVQAHPHIIFRNNDRSAGTFGLGAGQQEADDKDRRLAKLGAAVYLFDATRRDTYHRDIETLVDERDPLKNGPISLFDDYEATGILLFYAQSMYAKPALGDAIRDHFRQAMNQFMNSDGFLPTFDTKRDAYLSYLPGYYWGSNSGKAAMGQLFVELADGVTEASQSYVRRQYAQHYLHYLHGVNPFGMVYLSNMQSFGATRSVSSFYHGWFHAGSSRWGKVTSKTPGPAPGFLVGGPNAYYKVDACCPNNCGSRANNAQCDTKSLIPPLHQPPLKSYKDFNANWPLNSWELSENSNAYQVRYIRLLSHFVKAGGQCSVEK